jgi:hypothetical protein
MCCSRTSWSDASKLQPDTMVSPEAMWGMCRAGSWSPGGSYTAPRTVGSTAAAQHGASTATAPEPLLHTSPAASWREGGRPGAPVHSQYPALKGCCCPKEQHDSHKDRTKDQQCPQGPPQSQLCQAGQSGQDQSLKHRGLWLGSQETRLSSKSPLGVGMAPGGSLRRKGSPT